MKLFSTTCETTFLGWDAPLLPRVVDSLCDRWSDSAGLNLGNMVVVLPSVHAAGRFEDLLRRRASDEGWAYVAPRVITVGELPEVLYRPDMPVALDFEQTLAWAHVLRDAEEPELSPLLPHLPAAEPIGPWLELASTLRRLHEDLSSNSLGFSDVATVAETAADRERWQLLEQLFGRYLKAIAGASLCDPHWERRQAVLKNRCRTEQTVVLVGTSDLSESLVAMLRSVEGELWALVAAPPSESARFNEFGCIETAAWIDHRLPTEDHHWVAAGDIGDQATAVVESVAQFAEKWSAEEVTVGVTDESHVGPVELELRGCGVTTHRHLGWAVSQTSVGRLMSLTATHLHRGSWQSLAALVRHAEVHRMLSKRLGQAGQAEGEADEPHEDGNDSEAVPATSANADNDPAQGGPAGRPVTDGDQWLAELDGLLVDHLPVLLKDPLPTAATERYPRAIAIANEVEQWLKPFRQGVQSLAAWSELVDHWLAELHHTTGHELAPRTAMAFESVRRMLKRFGKLNGTLDVAVAGPAAIETLSGRLSEIRIVGRPSAGELEILGWLDLSLDDAAAMVVVGVNHPFLPASTTSDPFLPGTLRTRLKMSDNDRRYARDVYAMQVMVSARPEIRFVVGKSAADLSPTPPSRLLAAAEPVDAARRVRRLLSSERPPIAVRHDWDRGDQTRLPIPSLPAAFDSDNEPIVKSMSVTAFHDYLLCPYRFYLRHVLKLRPLDDTSGELAANQFGDLVHAALEGFGLSDDRDETDADAIESLLGTHLDQYAEETYGGGVSTAVRVQIAQARRRLKFVAQEQSRRIADGWKIHASEASVGPREKAGIEVDQRWMNLRGRFDRIDKHKDGRWAILDYKTHAHKPEKKHLRKTDEGETWVDLQLPLYRMMIPFLNIDVPPQEVELGYFNVAEKEKDTRINIAKFTPRQMDEAEQVIRQCVRDIWAGRFEPTEDRVLYDDYDMILQTGIAQRMMGQADSVEREVAR